MVAHYQRKLDPPLGPRIQRNAQAESLLSGCTLGPFKCPCNFSNWCLLPSESFQFANIGSGPFASFRLGSHIASYKSSTICRLGRQIGSRTAVLSLKIAASKRCIVNSLSLLSLTLLASLTFTNALISNTATVTKRYQTKI